MAVETSVSLHENPLEKVVIWERRLSTDVSKHRERPSTEKALEKGDLIVIRNSDRDTKSEYHRDYCVIAAATKSTRTPVRPALLSGRSTSLRLSNRNYESFSRRHLGGDLYSPPQAITNQPLSHNDDQHTSLQTTANKSAFAYESKNKQFENQDDVKIFCCGRDVEQMVERCTCVCCVKGFFYHCTKDSYSEGRIAERPCACGPLRPSCVKRWTCLTLCSIFLPCLLCYVPARGCLEVGKCYKQQKLSSVQNVSRFKEPR